MRHRKLSTVKTWVQQGRHRLTLRSWWRKSAAAVASTLAVVGLVSAGQTAAVAGDNRSWLRPDATGTCDWDAVGYWTQRCDVYSPAMERTIPVDIQPAARGGNAGYYVLDGMRARDNVSAWTTDVNAPELFAPYNLTLVLPIGGAASFYTDWEADANYAGHPVKLKWETFLTKELPAYLHDHFGVDPHNNSIAGLSMGGTAALNLASHHPDQFHQALSWSGYLHTTAPGMQAGLRLALIDTGGYNVNTMWGMLLSPRRFANDPYWNMDSLKDVDVYVSAGPGLARPNDPPAAPGIMASAWGLEVLSKQQTMEWLAKANVSNLHVTADFPPTGMHNWHNWADQMVRTMPRVLDRLKAW